MSYMYFVWYCVNIVSKGHWIFLHFNRYINFIWCHNHFSYGVHNAPELTPDLIQYLLHCVLLIMSQKTNSSNVFFNSVGLFLTYALLCLFIINLEFFCVCFQIPLNVWFSHVDLLIFFFFFLKASHIKSWSLFKIL